MKRQLLFLTLALIIGGAMALHDTDKNSEDRGAPTPNHSDVLPSEGVKAHKTISSHYASDADTTSGQLQMLNKQVVANDGTANKALFGYQQGLGLWGAFVAKPGVNVNTNTDLSQFIFNSSQNVFKIVQTGTLSLTPGTVSSTAGNFTSGHSTTSVAHGLSFTPAVIAYLAGGSQYNLLPYTSPSGSGATANWETYSCVVDATNVYFNVDTLVYGNTAVASAAFTMKYYLLQETAN